MTKRGRERKKERETRASSENVYGCFARVFPFTRCVCTRVVVCVARIRGRLVREANCISPLGFSAALYLTTAYTFYPRRKMRETVSFLPLLLGWNLKEPTGVFNRKGFEFIG